MTKTNLELRDKWAKREGVTLSNSRAANPSFLVGMKKARDAGIHLPYIYSSDLGLDHVSCWNKDGKPYCLVSQPYGLSTEALKNMLTTADILGLEIDISSHPSWHYPGAVLTVIWKKRK